MSDQKLLTPRFLTSGLAEIAVRQALAMIMSPPIVLMLKRQVCHIVVLVPAMEDDRDSDGSDYPNYTIQPRVIYEHSFGNKKDYWTGNYDEIARCKALQLWQGRNDDRTDIQPHLIFPGDTVYYGGVKRHGIVVTCSSLQAYFDKMLSGIVANLLIGISYHEWMMSDEKQAEAAFVG